MKRLVFNKMCRMVGMVIIVTLFCSCQAVTLRQAQNEYNKGVMLKNAATGEFAYADVHYKSALDLLKNVNTTGNEQLDISKDVLTALCYWQIADYKKADEKLQMLKKKISEAAPRDRVLINLLPALIKIDEAKGDIPFEYRRDEGLQGEVNQKIDAALGEIDKALPHAKSPMIRIYVLESGLEAYRVRQWAHNALGDRRDPAFDQAMKEKIKRSFLNPLPPEIGGQWRKTLGII